MSDNAAMVAYIALMTVLVVGCTASVAYWAHSSAGLWSLLVPLMLELRIRKDDCDHGIR